MKTMTIDELKKGLSEHFWAHFSFDSGKGSDEANAGAAAFMSFVINYIETNRPALEASMKGEIGKRKCSGCDETIYDQSYCDNCERLLES